MAWRFCQWRSDYRITGVKKQNGHGILLVSVETLWRVGRNCRHSRQHSFADSPLYVVGQQDREGKRRQCWVPWAAQDLARQMSTILVISRPRGLAWAVRHQRCLYRCCKEEISAPRAGKRKQCCIYQGMCPLDSLITRAVGGLPVLELSPFLAFRLWQQTTLGVWMEYTFHSVAALASGTALVVGPTFQREFIYLPGFYDPSAKQTLKHIYIREHQHFADILYTEPGQTKTVLGSREKIPLMNFMDRGEIQAAAEWSEMLETFYK